jgi:hypothetical protein
MTDILRCTAIKTNGERCEQTIGLDMDGLCQAHRPGGLERMREVAAAGGAASARKAQGEGFTADELPPIKTLEDAMIRLDLIQSAVLCRRIVHHEASSAAKAIDSWVKAHAAHMTQGLVNELRAELDAKTHEIESLRKQLAGNARGLRRTA